MANGIAYIVRSGNGRSQKIYHINPDCRNAPNDPIVRDISEVEKLGWDCCEYCSGDNVGQPDEQKEYASKLRKLE